MADSSSNTSPPTSSPITSPPTLPIPSPTVLNEPSSPIAPVLVTESSPTITQAVLPENPSIFSHDPHHQSTLPLLNITSFVTTKFNGSNYLVWKHQFENILYTTDLFDHVTGHTPPPSEFLPDSHILNPHYISWRRRDRYVMTYLTATFDPSIHRQVLRCTTAAEIWNHLKVIYLQQSRAKKSQLKEKLSTLKKGQLSITDYLNTLTGLADDLASINSPLEEDDLVIIALNGLALDRDYDNIVVNLKNQIHDLTMLDVRSKLLVHEEWLASSTALRKAHLESGFPSALAAQHRSSSFNRSSSSKPRFPSSSYSSPAVRPNNNPKPLSHFSPPSFSVPPQNKCFPISNSNHIRNSSGPTSHYSGSGSNHVPGSVDCQICKRPGHSAYNCRFRYHPKSTSNSGTGTSSSSQPLTQAFHSLHMNPLDQVVANEQWLADSGANAHMTNNPNNLHDTQSFDGSDQVMLGDVSFNRSSSS